MADPLAGCAAFLGTWVLMPETCVYEQGAPPRAGTYRIAAEGDALRFTIDWTAADGAAHHATFAGRPDGVAVPFAGGDAVDALAITLASPATCSTAFWRGQERMVAQRSSTPAATCRPSWCGSPTAPTPPTSPCTGATRRRDLRGVRPLEGEQRRAAGVAGHGARTVSTWTNWSA
jgi:hypothetical protein